MRASRSRVLDECRALFAGLGLAWESVPLILAGGLGHHGKLHHWLAQGAAGVQVGTAFAVTEECDAHPAFKQVLASGATGRHRRVHERGESCRHARRADAVAQALSLRESALQARARVRECLEGFDCLQSMRLARRRGAHRPVLHRPAALRRRSSGDVERGLFFRGKGALPFGEAIRPVAGPDPLPDVGAKSRRGSRRPDWGVAEHANPREFPAHPSPI